jgi:hypothetical protein
MELNNLADLLFRTLLICTTFGFGNSFHLPAASRGISLNASEVTKHQSFIHSRNLKPQETGIGFRDQYSQVIKISFINWIKIISWSKANAVASRQQNIRQSTLPMMILTLVAVAFIVAFKVFLLLWKVVYYTVVDPYEISEP